MIHDIHFFSFSNSMLMQPSSELPGGGKSLGGKYSWHVRLVIGIIFNTIVHTTNASVGANNGNIFHHPSGLVVVVWEILSSTCQKISLGSIVVQKGSLPTWSTPNSFRMLFSRCGFLQLGDTFSSSEKLSVSRLSFPSLLVFTVKICLLAASSFAGRH